MTSNWIEAGRADDIDPDEPLGVELEGRDIALFRIADEVFAPANLCTHAFARLSDGFFENGEIECPLHQGRFDVRTGKALCDPVETDVDTYPVKIEDGVVYVAIDGG